MGPREKQASQKKAGVKVREQTVKRMFASGLSHEQIADRIGRPVDWVRITLDDFDPKEFDEEERTMKRKQAETLAVSGKKMGRPRKPVAEKKIKQDNIRAMTTDEVIALYGQIRKDIKAGRWKTAGEAAVALQMDYELIFRLGKGYWQKD